MRTVLDKKEENIEKSAEASKVKPRVAFVVSMFPCYDEAFILRELDAIASVNNVAIFSLKKSKDKIIHDEAKKLIPITVYVPYLFSLRILKAHLYFIFKHPLNYLKVFFQLIFGNIGSVEFLFKNLVFFPKAVYLARWMLKEGVTHLHAYWATYPASVAQTASDLSGIPYSFTGHAHDIYLDTTHLREKMNKAAFISTCTSQNKDYLIKVAPDCRPDKILVNYHGLNLDLFKADLKKNNEKLEILSVGTLQYHKGFNYLIDAMEILQKRNISFHCTIVGGGALESDLRKHISMLGLEDQVTMTGALKQKQVIPYYKIADVLVLMAQSEWHWGIPNVIIEALAANAAVVTTRFGSVEELVKDEKTGLLVKGKDPESLANALERYAKDEKLRYALAEAGNQFVTENFNLKRNIQNFSKGLLVT